MNELDIPRLNIDATSIIAFLVEYSTRFSSSFILWIDKMTKRIIGMIAMMFVLSGVGSSPTMARTDIFDFCDTPQDYKRIQKYYREYKDPSDQMIEYMRKRLPKGKSARNLTKQEFRALSKGFKPVPINPPRVACQKIPGNTLVADKSGVFSGFACVRPPSWKTCKWIAYKALKARWHPGSQKGIWLRD